MELRGAVDVLQVPSTQVFPYSAELDCGEFKALPNRQILAHSPRLSVARSLTPLCFTHFSSSHFLCLMSVSPSPSCAFLLLQPISFFYSYFFLRDSYPKFKILSSFIHPYVVPNLFDLNCSVGQKKKLKFFSCNEGGLELSSFKKKKMLQKWSL